MNFLVLSIDHNSQTVPTKTDSRELLMMKARLADAVRAALADRGIQLICEESDPRRISVAQEIGRTQTPEVPWAEIDMTRDERERLGIADALANRPGHIAARADGTYYQVEYRIPEDEVREEFFVSAILAAANQHAANSVLVLCGDMHTVPIADRLRAKGYCVEADSYLVPEKHWR